MNSVYAVEDTPHCEYSAIKKNELLIRAMTCVRLKTRRVHTVMIPLIGNSRQAKLFYGRKRTVIAFEDKTVGIF